MQLYYTGAKTSEGVQINPELSLGGFKSSSLITNGNIGNFFQTITKSSISQNKKEIRMIALKNTTGVDLAGLKIWSISEKYSKIKLAAVAPAVDAKGVEYFEQIGDQYSIPYQATLSSHEGEVNALQIGELKAGKMIGLWIQRELDQTKFSNLDKGTTPDLTTDQGAATYIAELSSTEPEENDEISVVFSWS